MTETKREATNRGETHLVARSEDVDTDQNPRPIEPAESLTCNDAIDLMGAFLTHDLACGARDRLVAHVRKCAACHEKILALEIFLSVGARDGSC